MYTIAVFTNQDTQICDFFNADRFIRFERGNAGIWEATSAALFAPVTPSNPAETRKKVQALLPLIEGCDVLAGGSLVGIPFAVFDQAGLHIFEINAMNDSIFNGIIEDICTANAALVTKENIIKNAQPVETSTPGVYFLDLVALQKEYPEVTSKKAMVDFLRDTPLLELRLVCKHIPPWIENAGLYNVQVTSEKDGVVEAVITKKC